MSERKPSYARLERILILDRFDTLPPGDFKEGDIVDAAVTFMAFPLGKEYTRERPAYKLVIALRGLTLLTSEYREVSSEDCFIVP